MVIIAGILIGAIWGVIYVRRRGGKGFDIAQYAAVWGIIGAIAGIALTIGIEREESRRFSAGGLMAPALEHAGLLVDGKNRDAVMPPV